MRMMGWCGIVLGLCWWAVSAEAEISRFNPATGQTESLSGQLTPAPPAAPPVQAAPPRPPTATPAGPRPPVNDIEAAYQKALSAELARQARPIGRLGRIGIYFDPRQLTPNTARTIQILSQLPDLDKMYFAPSLPVGEMLGLLDGPAQTALQDLTITTDAGGAVRDHYGVKTLPALIYQTQPGPFKVYSLTDLAPFYQHLDDERRRVATSR